MKIRVAAAQMGAVGSKEENVEKAMGMLESLVSLLKHPQFICLPEMLSYLPNTNHDFHAIDSIAEEKDGPISQIFSDYAQKMKAYIVPGSYIVRKGGKHYNTSLLFGPNGDLKAEYSKTSSMFGRHMLFSFVGC